MVGKIKHARQRLHQAAAGSPGSSGAARVAAAAGSGFLPTPEKAITETSFPTGIFAGIKITPKTLVQTLKLEETPDAPVPFEKGPEEKTSKSKKEKMKERRERWLHKISSIKQAKEQQVAKARRQATPVVGDLKPLADALPEICQLNARPATPASAVHHKSRKMPVKRSEPRDFRQMKESQKRKLLEKECSWFSDTVKTFSAKKNPLAEIGEQLRKRMKQEEEQNPS